MFVRRTEADSSLAAARFLAHRDSDRRASSRIACRCAVLLSFVVAAAQVAAVSPTNVPAPAPKEFEQQIDDLFADLARSDSPGIAVAVIQDGRIVYENAFGMADLERGVGLTPASVFEIGSVSKQFTALSVLLLEHDGELSLDDDVRIWIPELPVYERPITIRHLLHHTSGIRDVETLLPLAGVPWFNYYTQEQSLELITRQKKLNFPPGQQHLYSNSGYLLLARIVEKVSGLSFRAFARRRIFEPLGMKYSEFWDRPTQVVTGRALPYARDEHDRWGQALWNLPMVGPSGLYTTVGDLALWDANFYDNRLGGGSQLIDKTTAPGGLANGDVVDYAAGLFLDRHRGRQAIQHSGAWMGYRSEMMRLPEERLTIILLSNASSTFVEPGAIADIFLPKPEDDRTESTVSVEAPAVVELPLDRLQVWPGTYWNETDQLLRTVEIRQDRLFYVRSEESATELGATDAQSFLMIGPSVQVEVIFTSGEDASDRTMTVTVEGDEPLLFLPIAEPTARELQSLVGTYWSEELRRELQLVLRGERIDVLWSDRPSQSTSAQLVSPDELVVPDFIRIPWNTQSARLRLQRNEAGAVRRLTLSSEMVRGVVFERTIG